MVRNSLASLVMQGANLAERSLATEVPEILFIIFKGLARCDQATAARVCRQWSDVVLDQLWSSLDSLRPVLQLLGPVIESRFGGLDIPDGLADVDWDRVASYTYRIQRLSWDADSDNHLSVFLCERLQTLHPTFYLLLPNLSELAWTTSYENQEEELLLVAPPSLKSFRLRLQFCTNETLGPILSVIQTRSIMLSDFQLTISMDEDLSEIDGALPDFIRGQRALQRIGLPFFFGTEAIVSALASLKELEEIGLTEWFLPEDGAGAEWAFPLGHFPKLSALGLAVWSLKAAVNIFKSYNLSRLLSITVASPHIQPYHQILQCFFSELSSSCPHLEEVRMNILYDEGSMEPEMEASQMLPVSFATLEPLLRSSGMTLLTIYAKDPIALCAEDVATLAMRWPRLRHLHLTVDPINVFDETRNVRTPLSVLSVFSAQQFPDLQHLGLFFTPDRSTWLDALGSSMLSILETLDVGASRISKEDVRAVAAYLGGVLRPGVNVEARRSVESDIHFPGIGDDNIVREAWEDVTELLQQIHASQKVLRYKLEVSEARRSNR
ncbi:hypothetical protein FRB98_009474 [Tulasnella sp. 332]|nr:hypothetical protein FRB98_009474 [Tulasnella sp. 332]